MKQTIIVNAALLVRDQRGRLLMQQYVKEGMWAIPGCEMQEGEELEQTLIAAFQRDTRLQVTRHALYKIFSGEQMRFQSREGTEFDIVLFVYTGEVDSIQMKEKQTADCATLPCSDEEVIFRFVGMEEMKLELCSAIQRPLLDQYIRSYKQEMLIQ